MRNIGDVIDQMLSVPSTPNEFRSGLLSIVDSIRYCAPENFGFLWGRLGELVTYTVQGKPYDELVTWEHKIVDILLDKK